MKNVLFIKLSVEFIWDITSFKNMQNTEAYLQVQLNNVNWKGIEINYLLHIRYKNIYLIKNKMQNIHKSLQTTKIELL